MMYEALEQSLADRLAPFAQAGVNVRVVPETESERKRPLPVTEAQFTVIYSGSEYGDTNSTSSVIQNEEIYISVVIESTFLRGGLGVYNLLFTLKKALIGFKPYGCQKIQAVKHHSIGSPEAIKRDNMWEYQAVFKTSTTLVEDYLEDITSLISKITYVDTPDGETTVIPDDNN